jgi:hypothetical protein
VITVLGYGNAVIIVYVVDIDPGHLSVSTLGMKTAFSVHPILVSIMVLY